ncbi:MAG: Uma2 family endonuclease [Chloroflexi bacterium]|nr:Uma2 family endonuclease [Chloroflexota bacterium]MBI3762044.1 Uma2 family endonuclease [Chloroflexota bacterium]
MAMTAPPPLENGDRLTRLEFERRYEAMRRIKKAELIEGVVHMPSPVRTDVHGKPHGHIMTWLGVYCAATPGVGLSDNGTLRLDDDNEVQPDGLLWIEGGRARLGKDGYLEGAPDLIVEVAASSAAIDLHEKRRAYRRNGVEEYIVWQVYDKKVDWFELSEGEYVPLTADERGVIHSQVFPGLHLAVPALLEGDLAGVLAELQKGLATPEHATFVKKLAEQK